MAHYTNSSINLLRVTARPGQSCEGFLHVEGRILRCALGRGGIGIKQGEGDGITPRGSFSLLDVMVRTDRIKLRTSPLGCRPILKNHGWCDAAGDRNYNRPVDLPYHESYENLWREDGLYDVVVVLDYNIERRMGVGGSAIFFHIAHDDYRPTQGCVAISQKDMLWLLPRIGRETVMVIG